MRKLAVSFLLLCSAVSPVQASDIGGFRLEVKGGLDSISQNLNEILGDEYGGPDLGRWSKSGFVYGGSIGYDLPINETIAFGVDAEYTGSSVKLRETYLDEVVDAIGHRDLKAGRDLYIGGRLTGWLAPNVAIFGTAGYTNLRSTLRVDVEDAERVNTQIEAAYADDEFPYEDLDAYLRGVYDYYGPVSDNIDGFRLGAGLQYALAGGGYVSVEYRYSNYGRGVARSQGLLGVGYRF